MDIKSCARVLTHLGYSVRKDSLTPLQVAKIKKELNVAPATVGKFAKGESFSLYMETPSRYYLPRIWAQDTLGSAEANILVDGEPLRTDLKFVGKPYDYQEAIVNTFVENPNGLICVPCGRGKTFMAIAVAARLGRRFMIIVDKEFLLQQWRGELETLMPGIRIGIVQGDKKEIGEIPESWGSVASLKATLREVGLKVGGTRDELIARYKEHFPTETHHYDCCIAMIQTLVQRDFAETDFRSFGFAIFDECHHLGASHFSRALLRVQTKYMLGLSATPTRDDGLTKVFEWYLGKPVYWEKTREADPDVIVRRVDFDSDDPAYTEVPVDYQGETVLARLLTQVVECEARNERIDEVMKDLAKESKRRILVLSERISHLQRIEAGLPKGTTVSYYIGGMKEEVREEGARTAQVLLGTYAMASEAMNIKTLNTMVMASPRKKIEQSTGRILRIRKDEREVQPLIVDIVDSHSVYQGQWMKRKAYYKRCAYKLEGGSASGVAEPVAPPNFTQGCMILDD